MRSTGTRVEWARFLEAKSPTDASAALGSHVRQLEVVYDQLSACVVRLWEAPMPEIPDALLIARAATAEAMSLLEHVRTRVEDDEAAGAA